MMRREEGSALIVAIVLGSVLAVLVTISLRDSIGQVEKSARQIRSSTSFQAAEAGVNDYIAKLSEDHFYHLHFVHPAESTRRRTNGTLVAPGQPWPGDLTWTYPTPGDSWRPMANGYEYNLQVVPPPGGSTTVTMQSTGRRIGGNRELRSVEATVRPASIADFQRIVNGDIGWGPSATTEGKLYAGIDSAGVPHHIFHQGTARGDLYAEGQILNHPTYENGAQGYDGTTIRSVIKNPINFSLFTQSLVDVQRAAQTGGLQLDNPAVDGWRLKFTPDGRVAYASCMRTAGQPMDTVLPTCGPDSVVTVPVNGAIYSPQRVIVSWTDATGTPLPSVLDGRVTVVSNLDIIVGGDISYEVRGDDVLGLIGRNNIVIAAWVSQNLTWYSANLAQTGTWHTQTTTTTHNTMTHVGSTTTDLGGWMTMFNSRNYSYDPNLLFLSPPWFPILEEAYTIQFFRELTPTGGPISTPAPPPPSPTP